MLLIIRPVLENVVQYGHQGAIELVYGALGECLLDQNAQIRLSVLKVAAFWFTELRDRYSYFRYLLPLVLIELVISKILLKFGMRLKMTLFLRGFFFFPSRLTDDFIENREEAYKLWGEIGVQYLCENSEDLKEKDELLPKELEHYPVGGMCS